MNEKEKLADIPQNSVRDKIERTDSSHVEHLRIGKVRSESAVSDSTTDGATRNSVPASVMSHPHSGSGADLERGPTGPKNKTVDDEGRIVVNWESRADPANPKNWPKRRKVFNVAIISAMTFLCPLCSAMFVRPHLSGANTK